MMLIGVTFDAEVAPQRDDKLWITQDHIHFFDAGLLEDRFEGDLRPGDRVRISVRKLAKGRKRRGRRSG